MAHGTHGRRVSVPSGLPRELRDSSHGGESRRSPEAAGDASSAYTTKSSQKEGRTMRGIRRTLRVTVLTMLLIGISTTGVPMRILGQDAKVALDVYLLVDQKGSFKDDNATFQNQAQSLLRDLFSNPALDLRVGLGIFRDYPIAPFGDRGISSTGDYKISPLT
jgi:hypothetical protein